MTRLSEYKAWCFALAAAAALLFVPRPVGGADVHQEGCVEPPQYSLPPLPPLTGSPVVKPEDSGEPWTATFNFHDTEFVSIAWGCFKYGEASTENVNCGTTVVGRYGHGNAEEIVTLSIAKPTGTKQTQPWMGTHTVTFHMQCPDGDPWLTGKPCKLTGTATPIPGITFKGPFPLTRSQVPVAQREQLLYRAFPPKFVQPKENQQIANGAPVTIQLAKTGPYAAQPVELVFSSGSWATAKTFKKTMTGSTANVQGTSLGPGEWTVTARYVKDLTIDPVSRKFIVLGGWGGGPPSGASATKPKPDAGPPVAPAPPIVPTPPVVPVEPRPLGGRTRSR